MQCKDLPDDLVVAVVKAVQGRWGVPYWSTTQDVLVVTGGGSFSSNEGLTVPVVEVPPAEEVRRQLGLTIFLPEKLTVAKLRALIRRGVLGGCVCGGEGIYCRGDLEIMEEWK